MWEHKKNKRDEKIKDSRANSNSLLAHASIGYFFNWAVHILPKYQ